MSDPGSARLREVCRDIQADVKADVEKFDGAPFTGRTLAELHGNLSAAVSALAAIVAVLVDRTASDA